MNITQLYHFAAFAGATSLYLYRVPWWVILILAAMAIEADQAFAWADPWWKWFCKLDTWLDIAAGLLGILITWSVL